MILYHTSTVEIRKSDVLHSRKFLDFGAGFYVTTLKEQARRYGKRITKEQALDLLRFEIPNCQMCITSQKCLDKHLRFLKSIKVSR